MAFCDLLGSLQLLQSRLRLIFADLKLSNIVVHGRPARFKLVSGALERWLAASSSGFSHALSCNALADRTARWTSETLSWRLTWRAAGARSSRRRQRSGWPGRPVLRVGCRTDGQNWVQLCWPNAGPCQPRQCLTHLQTCCRRPPECRSDAQSSFNSVGSTLCPCRMKLA